MGKILDPHQADGIGTCRLISLRTADHLMHIQHTGMGAGDDRQIRVHARFQCRADFPDAFVDADQVGGLAPELCRQQGVFKSQCGNPGALQLHHRAHDVERIAVAMIRIGDDRQAADTANARGLLDKFAEGDQCEVGGCQNL